MLSSTPTTDAETGAKSNRRTAVRDHALAALVETDADGETVKATVLRELYHQQPVVSLEDILELNVVVGVPDSGPLDERVAAVLAEAVAQHDSWADTPPAALGENTSLQAPEGQ